MAFIPLQFNKANLQRLLTAIGTYVSSWSGRSTGLTPSTPTTGDVVLGGVLNVANGGTGSTTSTGTAASGVVLRTSPTINTSLNVSGGANVTAFSVSSLLNTTASVVNVLDYGITVTAANASSMIERIQGGAAASTILRRLDTTGNEELVGYALIARGDSITAGGSQQGLRLFNVTAGVPFGVFGGSGSPTIVANRGSLYLDTSGKRPYFNTNGSSAWSRVGGGAIKVTAFTSTSTWFPDDNMTSAFIRAWGGGGAGGSAVANGTASSSSTGGGGGAGAYSEVSVSKAAAGTSQTVTIGIAGAAAATGNNPGGNGGTTSVGTLLTAPGGTGGGGANGTNNVAVTAGAGGTAGTGDLAAPGMPGMAGIQYGAVSVTGSSGGSSLVGGGAASVGGAFASATGGAGTGRASGGSGGLAVNGGANTAGGAGTAGYVVIIEFTTN